MLFSFPDPGPGPLQSGLMRPFLLAAAVLLGVFAFSPGPAAAADWSFTPGIKGTEEYNDNVLFTRRYQLDDFITRIKPVLRILGRTEKTLLFLDSTVTGEKYMDNSALDTVNTNNSAMIQRSWNEQFSTRLRGTFSKDETLESELEAAGLRGFRKTRYRYGFDASGQYALSDTVSLALGGGPEYSRYPDGPYPDMDLWHVYVNPSAAIDPRDTVGLFVNYEHADYETSSIVKTLSASLYYRRELGETAHLLLGGGYRHTWASYESIYLGLGLDNLSGRYIVIPLRKKRSGEEGGFIFNAELENDWTERFSTVASAGREHYNSVDVRSIDLTYLRTTFKYRWTETISGNLRLSYDSTTEDGPASRDTDNINVEPFISWSVTPKLILKFGGAYRYEKEDYRQGSDNIERFKGWIAFSYKIPRLFANH